MTSQNSADRTSGRHRTDYLSLIFGLLFLAVAGWWAASYYLNWAISLHLPDAGWVLAAGLILLGLIGILASLRRDRRNGEPETTPLAVDDRGTALDEPTAGDPGGHRPE
ncbi:MAG: hypothetical protein IRY85_03180 [Micromonosporaceae bacterium]|nr:hypothetical protein [Micromonosporaceae bacterium]